MTDTETALRAHLRSHNQGVLAASGMALIFSVIGWAVLYGAAYWAAMFIAAAVRGTNATRPAEFNLVFFGIAAVLMLAARIDQWLFPHERAVDERPKIEHFADALFFVPRFTMSCWQNLGALARLTDAELPEAAELMDTLRPGGRVALQELPARFPDEHRRQRMLDALLVTGLIDMRIEEDTTWLCLGALAPEAFRGRAGSLPRPEDPLAGVPEVKVPQGGRLLRKREDGSR